LSGQFIYICGYENVADVVGCCSDYKLFIMKYRYRSIGRATTQQIKEVRTIYIDENGEQYWPGLLRIQASLGDQVEDVDCEVLED